MPVNDDVLGQFRSALGEGGVITERETLERHAVDGVVPSVLLQPESPEQVGAALRVASQNGVVVVPRGSGTKCCGARPKQVDAVLAMTGLSEIVEHDVDNLTVTAQAGLRLSELQGALAREGQMLPLDPPFASPAAGNGATIGGVLAARSTGPKRLVYGAPRDLVLGLKAVLSSGATIAPGGKTVKNVSGYDLCKLFIGSLGTLGVLTEATFRLLPLPEEQATLLCGFPDASSAERVAFEILQSQLLPSALELLDSGALKLMGKDGFADCALLVAVEGAHETVARQVRQVTEIAQAAGALGVERDDSDRTLDAVRNLPEAAAARRPGVVLCKTTLPLSRSVEWLRAVHAMPEVADLVVAQAVRVGSGLVYTHLSSDAQAGSLSFPNALSKLREAASALRGRLIVERAPADLKGELDVWGPVGNDLPLMRKVKQTFDPAGILSPGRFVGGI